MNSDSQKATAFIERLMQNPALTGYSILQQEEQLIQFLHVNAAQLAPTLGSQQFFPGRNWNQIFSELVQALYAVTDAKLIPDIEKILASRIDFAFVQLLRQQQLDVAAVRKQLVEMVKKLLQRPDTRRAFTGAYTAFHFNLSDRYLEEVYLRKSYIHFEITKVQRLRLGKDEARNFVDIALLLRPVIALYMGSSSGQGDRSTGMVQNQYAEKAFSQLKKDLRALPDPVLNTAMFSNVSFNDNRFVEATARLIAILAARARNYHPNVNVDRGADSPDKSWLNTARRNYKFYGFDIKMLDELYKIAAENIW